MLHKNHTSGRYLLRQPVYKDFLFHSDSCNLRVLTTHTAPDYDRAYLGHRAVWAKRGCVFKHRMCQNCIKCIPLASLFVLSKLFKLMVKCMAAFFVCWFINDFVLIGPRVPQAPLRIANWWNANRVDGRHTQSIYSVDFMYTNLILPNCW